MASPAGIIASIPTLFLFFLFFSGAAAAAAASSTKEVILEFTSRCPFPVWPAIVPLRQGLLREVPGVKPGEYFGLEIPVADGGPTTYVWGRTGCRFGRAGRGHCRTGDCGGGLRNCGNDTAAVPETVTRAEFSLRGGRFRYGVTALKGFNVPMEFFCITDAARCAEAGCHDGAAATYRNQKHRRRHVCRGNDVRLRVVFCPP
ncbi:hypothetical protein BRADI_4g03285v3 [Brachypodium distachyon]|uniref:Thaumatin-like protein n=1 Tax=Brachypodium distachyon TaxID=15368 RepID=A0A0Q3IIR4_BRADI|nr:hypothetical protein BRADI_4g03285v3 [Brachypodium distachyon]